MLVRTLGASGPAAPARCEGAALSKAAGTVPAGCGGGPAHPACPQMPEQSWGSSAEAPLTFHGFVEGPEGQPGGAGRERGAGRGVPVLCWAAKARCVRGLQGTESLDLDAVISSL